MLRSYVPIYEAAAAAVGELAVAVRPAAWNVAVIAMHVLRGGPCPRGASSVLLFCVSFSWETARPK